MRLKQECQHTTAIDRQRAFRSRDRLAADHARRLPSAVNDEGRVAGDTRRSKPDPRPSVSRTDALDAAYPDLKCLTMGLRQAAEQGCVSAMFDLATVSDDPRERRRWLREAARNGWEDAIVRLAESEC